MADHCSECTPCSQPYCGFCGDGPYSPTGPFAARPRATQEPAPVSQESLLAEFDARAQSRRAAVKAELDRRSPRVPSKKELSRRRVAREARQSMPLWLVEADDAQNADLEALRESED